MSHSMVTWMESCTGSACVSYTQAGSNGLSIELWIERNAGGPYASARYRENMFVAITAGVSSELELCPGNTLISLLDYSGAMSLWFNFNDGDGTQGCALAKAVRCECTESLFMSEPYSTGLVNVNGLLIRALYTCRLNCGRHLPTVFGRLPRL